MYLMYYKLFSFSNQYILLIYHKKYVQKNKQINYYKVMNLAGMVDVIDSQVLWINCYEKMARIDSY